MCSAKADEIVWKRIYEKLSAKPIPNERPIPPFLFLDESDAPIIVIMNAANEAAVAAYLRDDIGFYDITDIVSECMNGSDFVAAPDLQTIFMTNEAAYRKASEMAARIAGRKSF